MEQKQEEVATILGLGERQKTFVEQKKKVRLPFFLAYFFVKLSSFFDGLENLYKWIDKKHV